MRKILFIMVFTLIYSQSYSQEWTYISNETFLPYDSPSGEIERLFESGISIYNDKIVIDRGSYNKVLLIYENNLWKSIAALDFNRLCIDTTISMNGEGIWSFEYDNEGNLWGCAYFGLFKYVENNIYTYKYIYENSDSLSIKNKARELKLDNNNIPWIISSFQIFEHTDTIKYKHIICKFDGEKIDSQFFYNQNGESDLGPLIFDRYNNIWIKYHDTILIFENNKIKEKIHFDDMQVGFEYFVNILIDKENHKYLFTNKFNLYCLDNDSFIKDDFVQQQSKLEFPDSNSYLPTFICMDSSQNLWFTICYSKFLYKRSQDGIWTTYLIPQPDLTNGEWKIGTIAADCSGRIWFTVSNYGIFILDPDAISVEEYPKTESNGLPDVWIRKVYPNPTIEKIEIDFFLERGFEKSVKCELFNSLGMKIKNIDDTIRYDSYNMDARINFFVGDLTVGIYFIGISAGNSKKMTGFAVER